MSNHFHHAANAANVSNRLRRYLFGASSLLGKVDMPRDDNPFTLVLRDGAPAEFFDELSGLEATYSVPRTFQQNKLQPNRQEVDALAKKFGCYDARWLGSYASHLLAHESLDDLATVLRRNVPNQFR